MAGLPFDRILFATHNGGKLDEMRQMLGPRGIEVLGAKDFDLPEPEETEDSFVGNARIKAHAAAKATGLMALADDSGLCVDALNGDPGVRTADWAETASGRDFGLAMRRVYESLQKVGAQQPWTATFHSVLVLASPDGSDKVFSGEIGGTLVWPIRGIEGHGYDPMFVPDGHDQTFAEMSPEMKNSLSHRSKALAKLLEACFT